MSSSNFKQRLFNSLEDLITELIKLFPENSEIRSLEFKYFLCKKTNSNLIIDHVIDYIYPFKKQILMKDETFFLEGGGQEDITDESALKFKENIKSLWEKELSDDNKDIVWNYFKAFIIFTEKIIAEDV